MGNILSFLQEIFFGKENNSMRVGISEFKKTSASKYKAKKTSIFKTTRPQELRLSELMRKGA